VRSYEQSRNFRWAERGYSPAECWPADVCFGSETDILGRQADFGLVPETDIEDLAPPRCNLDNKVHYGAHSGGAYKIAMRDQPKIDRANMFRLGKTD
jgi:hypothetical protein